MKWKASKCDLLISGHKQEQIWADKEEDIFLESNVEFLRTVIDNQLKFGKHIRNVCSKASIKVSVLTRMINYLDPQKKLLVKACFESQFRYCSLVWIFHSRQSNKKISRLHESAFRLIYDQYNVTLEKLLERGRFCAIHESNIQQLA